MEEIGEPRHPIVTSVLVVTGVMIAICAGWGGAAYTFDLTAGAGAGTLTTLLSILAGASWFRRKTHRAMSHRERLGFASGIALLNVAFPIAYWALTQLLLGHRLSLASLDLALGGGTGHLDRLFAWVMLYALSMSFVLASFFGWLYTRDPRKSGTTANDTH